jgi:hypothetical protein
MSKDGMMGDQWECETEIVVLAFRRSQSERTETRASNKAANECTERVGFSASGRGPLVIDCQTGESFQGGYPLGDDHLL